MDYEYTIIVPWHLHTYQKYAEEVDYNIIRRYMVYIPRNPVS